MGLRFKMRDAAGPGRRIRPTRDAAERTEVAVYRGEQYVADRVADKLIISAIAYSPTKGEQKTPVASYEGGARYTAERDGDDLIIYAAAEDEISEVRTGDQRARDALKKIRDSQAPIKAMQQAADKLWGDIRSAQDAVSRA